MGRLVVIDDNRIKCSRCGVIKDISNFKKLKKPRKDGSYGWFSWCRECVCETKLIDYHKRKDELNAKKAMDRKLNPERHSGHNRKKLYGITQYEFESMLASQAGRCAICFRIPTGNSKNRLGLHVDHDHKTGVIRGLLCHGCNTSLGALRENISILKSMIDYIEENHCNV